MIRILIFIALIFALSMGYAWLADRPGTVIINWLDTEIELSVLVGINVLMAILVAGIITWGIIRGIFRTPDAVRGFFQARRRDKGYEALSRGFIAVGAGDRALALKASKTSRKFLPDDSMTLMLEAQSAQLSDDSDSARAAFEAMLERPETRLLGLRGLFMEAQRHGEAEAARHFAEEAVKAAPAIAWAGKALMGHQITDGDWSGALQTLTGQGNAKHIDKKTLRRQRAVLLTAQGLELEAGEPEKARALALEAHRLASDLVPAAALAGRVLGRLGDPRKAAKIIETTWKKAPHPDLLDAYEKTKPGESGRERLRRVRHLVKTNPDDRESRLAIIGAQMVAQNWSEARALLGKTLMEAPTRQACELMARLEQDESGNDGRVREWLSRALKAPRDKTWIADGVESEQWAPVSPVTGALDAFEWKAPLEALSADDGLIIDEAMLTAPKPAAEPAMTAPETATAEETVADAEIIEDNKPSEEITLSAEPTEPVTSPSSEASTSEPAEETDAKPEEAGKAEDDTSAEATAADEPDEPQPVEFPLPHAPDDPGPAPSGDDEPKRARLF
ncbi:heme biosynthesis protein HemY [Coralliovum pocilloporae]|uniref:heme biosynthesis protein HemY n=1 Tax=Coralliovum pocilloporae TaxID=3066369 RepID=UPI0033073A88